MNQIIISEKRVKKSVKKRQHKIKQTNHRSVLKRQSKRSQEKRYSRVETLHSFGYSVKEIAQDSQVNMSLRMLKIL